MQHDHIQIFLTFYSNLQVEGVCKDKICACMVLYAPFPSCLICNMTTFRKKNVLTFDPSPAVEGVFKDRICACMLLHLRFHLI